ncbi:MAG: flagellar assembly protein FliW, partial [Opitutaceae bacterium]|nr:flagellar assembly protein FliW [Verrucomicrobiales bacterium]
RIQFPLGLLGFEQIKEYELLADPAEEPFMWLQMVNSTSQSFLVVPPTTIVPDYDPEISPEDVAFLELREPGDALLVNIVTLRGRQEATANLKGPIVINRHTLIAKQVIPLNVAKYSLQFPLE